MAVGLIEFPEWLVVFSNHAEHYGLPFVLSLICLLQYLLHLYYRYYSSNRELLLRSDLKSLEGEKKDLQRERYLTRVENMILRDIFSDAATGRAVELLLKQFVPNATQGLVIFFCRENSQLQVFSQRGLTPQSASTITLDSRWVQQVLEQRVIRLTPSELANSEFMSSLSSRDRKKVEQLHLFAVVDGNEIYGIIAASQLFPPNVDLPCQQELVSRILESITGSLKQTMQVVDQQQLLKLTQEKLALRAIADRNYDMPTKMLDDYVERLCRLVGADRGTLMHFATGKEQPYRVISRQGPDLHSGLEALWWQHEVNLANFARRVRDPSHLNSGDLRGIGIESLIGSALAIPLYQQSKMVAILCLMRRDQSHFTPAQINLAEWAGNFLGETLLRAMDRIEIERMASMDGLTELANRRTFDQRIKKELESARTQSTECSLCLLDLDHFKALNDNYGHQAGDEVLRQFARLLEKETQKIALAHDPPLVARYGGEEMALWMPGMPHIQAVRVAESVRHAVEKTVILFQGQRLRMSVSIGVAGFPRHAMTVETLIKAADQALYQAKREGRNTVRMAQEGLKSPFEQPMPVVQ